MDQYKIIVFDGNNLHEYEKIVNTSNSNRPDEETIRRRKWWCFNNPNGGAFAVATFEDQVVATCYLAGKKIALNDTELLAFEIGETSTRPEHQRKGLFSRLVKAATEYAFEHGADLVYGTPNGQSTPGYEKIGFSIIEDPNSHFFVRVKPLSLLLRKAGLERSDNQSHSKVNTGSTQINAAEYKESTRSLERLNIFSDRYFDWRFTQRPSQSYKFFRTTHGYVALRTENLGDYKALLVTEYFPADRRSRRNNIICALKDIDKTTPIAAFDCYHFLANRTSLESASKFPLKYHRPLPICAVQRTAAASIIDQLKRSGLPQLSDCDIG